MDDRIEAWARECIAEDREDPIPGYYRNMNFARFAALVRAAALEEAAKVAVSYTDCHARARLHHTGRWEDARQYHAVRAEAGGQVAAAIRALATPS